MTVVSCGQMILCSLLILGFSRASLAAQEKAGTKQAVEARLKAGEKPRAVGPLDAAVNTLFTTHRFEQALISPDGKSVAWVETLVGKDGAPNGNTAIYVAAREGKAPPKRITAGTGGVSHAEGNVAWSPDSRHIAFLSDALKAGQLQLYVVSSAGGAAKKLTGVKGYLATPGWSPDGKTIAVLFTENATRAAGPLVAETPETGE